MQNLTIGAVIVIIIGAAVVTFVTLTGGDSPPKGNILILLDTSAAMNEAFEGGTKIEAAVTTINELVAGLQEASLGQVALRQYGGPCVAGNTGLVVSFDEPDDDAIRSVLDNVAVVGGTTLVSGIEATAGDFTELDQSGDIRRAIIVAGAGDSCDANLSEGLRRLSDLEIEVTFIGLGISETQVRELNLAATGIAGGIFFVETRRELADALSTVIRELAEDFGTFVAAATLTPTAMKSGH